MLKQSLVLVAAAGLCAEPLFAQADKAAPSLPPAGERVSPPKGDRTSAKPSKVSDAPRGTRKSATPMPTATPIPEKPGFWKRVFGNKRTEPEPATPKPSATPKPKSSPAKPRPAPKKPTVGPSEETTPDQPSKEEPKEEVAKPAPISKKTTKASKNADAMKAAEATASENLDPDAVEKAKYEDARAKAMESPKVKDLREKADTAPGEEESRNALRAYNKALFEQIRTIDPSLRDYTTKMESAVMRRLGE